MIRIYSNIFIYHSYLLTYRVHKNFIETSKCHKTCENNRNKRTSSVGLASVGHGRQKKGKPKKILISGGNVQKSKEEHGIKIRILQNRLS